MRKFIELMDISRAKIQYDNIICFGVQPVPIDDGDSPVTTKYLRLYIFIENRETPLIFIYETEFWCLSDKQNLGAVISNN